MNEKAEQLKTRSKKFALRVLDLFRELPRSEEGRVLGNQVLRSATSVAANYPAACRARSKAEFVSKIGIVVEEADETEFWLEMIVEGRVMSRDRVSPLLKEAGELVAIFAASQVTARSSMGQ